jgi:hypothetical protein
MNSQRLFTLPPTTEAKSSPTIATSAISSETKSVLLNRIIQTNLSADSKVEEKFMPGGDFTQYLVSTSLEKLYFTEELKKNAPGISSEVRNFRKNPSVTILKSKKESQITDDSICYQYERGNCFPIDSEGNKYFYSTFLPMTAAVQLGEMERRLTTYPNISTIVAAVNTFPSPHDLVAMTQLGSRGGDGYAYFDPNLHVTRGAISPGSYKLYPFVANGKRITVYAIGVEDMRSLDLSEDHTHTLKKLIWDIANQEKGSVAVHCNMGFGRTGHMMLIFSLIQRFMSLTEEEIRRDQLLEGGFTQLFISVVNEVRGVNAKVKIPGANGSEGRIVSLEVIRSSLIVNNEQYAFAIINAFAVYLYACRNGLCKNPSLSLGEYMEKSLENWIVSPLPAGLKEDHAISPEKLKKIQKALHNIETTIPAPSGRSTILKT